MRAHQRVAYALFAFAVGALLGALIRRTVPALAATQGVYVVARVAVQNWVRPHLLTPVRVTQSLANGSQVGIASINRGAQAIVAQGNGPANSWTLASRLYTTAGQPTTFAERTAFIREHCADLAAALAGPGGRGAAAASGNDPGQACINLASHTFNIRVTYLPADRYWTLQCLEAGIFIGLALACALGCYLWVNRRIS